MSISHELYTEMAQIRAAAQRSARYQALQTGIMCHMQGSLNSIGGTMIGLQRQNSDILAIQQELLEREQIQAELEEFIYRAESLIKECISKETDIPYSSRYFLLMSVKTQIEQSGLTTAYIRGRDNKAAFEKVVRNIDKLLTQLVQIKEVQEAIEWAKQENDKRLKQQRDRQQSIATRINELQRQRQTLVGKLQKCTIRDSFKATLGKFEEWGLPKSGTFARTIINIGFICISPLFLLAAPIFIIGSLIDAKQIEAKRNQPIWNEIALIDQQIGSLQ